MTSSSLTSWGHLPRFDGVHHNYSGFFLQSSLFLHMPSDPMVLGHQHAEWWPKFRYMSFFFKNSPYMKMFECGFADQGTFLTQQTRSHETALYVECCDFYFSFFYSGLGTSLVTIPGIFMINDYFETWKATAMGLCCIGQGVAMLAAPPLMLHLFTHYGHQWGLLLIAALCLHGCVGGALFRQLQQNSYMNGKFNSHRDSKKRDCNKNGSFSMDLLLNVNFLSFVILMLALNFCNSVLSGLLPALAVENDLSLNNATLILALMGIGDIFGSPMLGFILDRECLQGKHFYWISGCNMIVAICVGVNPFFYTSTTFILLAITRSTFIGHIGSQRLTLLGGIVPRNQVHGALGIMLLCQSAGSLAGRGIGGKYKWDLHIPHIPYICMPYMPYVSLLLC